ncbi:hypothetical protein DS2_06091 [Catenovulum agarivorans DS-2]|uniref:Diacylglycerol kinase catalytic subunit n=1 Tax=Catenovulum agarivorans DS-2 TaxID=1328313 RepID=W7QSJ5_9ALTE|nr:diacylglycerol kinase family protein [Catenovulum agarivorans]EWH10838.1 hypothetical protein DS2_06091 [Catenovulum agarivorans DS-2]
MRLGSYYLSAAFLLTLFTYWIEGIFLSTMLGWTALSLYAVSLAYMLNKPKIFRKRSDGRIPTYIKWLFLPFFLATQVYNTWARKNDSVPAIQQITPQLYLGCRLFYDDLTYLKAQNVDAVLDATSEFSALDWSSVDADVSYLNIPILDHSASTYADVKRAINWIDHHLKHNRGVVVHCALGRGRSVFLLAAYLVASNTCRSVKQALSLIGKTRTTSNLNRYQRRKLEQYLHRYKQSQQKKALLIANPVSGNGSWSAHRQEIESRLSKHFNLTIEQTTESRSAKQIYQQHNHIKYDVVIACGGDGTVNEVASQLVDHQQTLAIIPLGTTNALSHVLYGVRAKLSPIETACDVIIHGETKKIDTLSCNGEVALLLVGLGFEEKMISAASREQKKAKGELAYIEALIEAFGEDEAFKYQLIIDKQPSKTIEATSLVLANAAPFSTILAQGGGSPDPFDGKLNGTILSTKENTAIALATLGIRGLTNTDISQADNLGVEHFLATAVTIEQKTPIKYVIDGEPRTADSLDIKVKSASLSILVPT